MIMQARTTRKALASAASIALAIAMAFALAVSFPSSAFANPDDAVPPTSDGTVGIYGSGSGSADRDPDDNELGIADDEQLRSEKGRVSQLSTTTHNPYNKQIRLQIDIGSEFADFEGCEVTEGYIMKVSPGGMVKLPALRARDGYYFVGWGQGGVAKEPTWDPFVTEVEMGTDTSNGKNTTIFALFSDEEGNGYCTCGAYESGIYADRLDDIKADNEIYNESLGYLGLDGSITAPMKVGGAGLLIALCVVALIFAARRDHQDGLNGDTEYL